MRKHLRYDAPDKGERKSGQDSLSSSDRLSAKQTMTIISNIYPRNKSRTNMTPLNLPLANYTAVIYATTFIYICLFILIRPSNQQQNTQLCPKVCTCDDQSLEVSCKVPFMAPGLPHTLNPSTKRITINHAQTTQVTSSDLELFKSLEVLDLAFNKLTTIDSDHIKSNINLISLNASHNNIIEFKDSAVMLAMSKLSASNLIYNLSSITESDEYKKLRRSKINVVELNLSYNQLTSLRNFTFMRWHRLQRLDISYNLIEVLEHESLFGLAKLEHLSLRGNRIAQIPANAIKSTARSLSYISSNDQTISALDVIDLSENPLLAVDTNSFYALSRLRELYLDSCLINTIDSQAFTGLSSIAIISLTNNDLVEVPSEALSSLTTLKILKLSSNDIRSIHPFAFKNLYNLEEIQLNNGSLIEVEPLALSGLVSLKNLELNYNSNLSRVSPSIFEELPKLTHLSIQMGSLTTLIADEDIAKHPLVVVDLRGNSLVCDCNLKWLTHSLQRLNETTSSIQQDKTNSIYAGNPLRDIMSKPIVMSEILNITCSGPSALLGKQIINLPINKLECLKPSSSLNVHLGFASLFFMILVLTTVCLINFCRNEKHLMGILKENIVHKRIAMMLPYGHDAHKNTDNFRKDTQIECAEYEPIDYGQNYAPIYTLPGDQYINDSFARQQQTQQL
uniref:Leucine-rich repeat neuronal protein 1 n=1 Tax=Aceria tosichella TaxID=561515 RepID=A0A6G1SAW0_9ACAR